MKFNEFKSTGDGGTVTTARMLSVVRQPRAHYMYALKAGCLLPSTRQQAAAFIRTGWCLDLLGYPDAVAVEGLLSKHGFEGNYVYTKSMGFVRLVNQVDLDKALRAEYLK